MKKCTKNTGIILTTYKRQRIANAIAERKYN